MKNLLIWGILIIVFTGCSSEVNDPQPDESLEYLPISEGSFWNYSYTGEDTISATKKIFTKYYDQGVLVFESKFYMKDSPFSSIDNMPTTNYHVKNGIVYDFVNDKANVYLDFNLKDGDTYTHRGYIVTVSQNVTINTPLGEFECIKFRFDMPSLPSHFVEKYFAKEIGQVKLVTEDYDLIIHDYYIK